MNYSEDEKSLIRSVEHELMLTNDPDKYLLFLEHKKKESFLVNECMSLELNLANMVLHEFYGTND